MYIVYGVWRTVYGVLCTVYIIQDTMYNAQRTIYNIQYTIIDFSRSCKFSTIDFLGMRFLRVEPSLDLWGLGLKTVVVLCKILGHNLCYISHTLKS